jgi:hypothetical protein
VSGYQTYPEPYQQLIGHLVTCGYTFVPTHTGTLAFQTPAGDQIDFQPIPTNTIVWPVVTQAWLDVDSVPIQLIARALRSLGLTVTQAYETSNEIGGSLMVAYSTGEALPATPSLTIPTVSVDTAVQGGVADTLANAGYTILETGTFPGGLFKAPYAYIEAETIEGAVVTVKIFSTTAPRTKQVPEADYPTYDETYAEGYDQEGE